ncbi:NAD(P)/FAD-dependent oxidoreductase [Mycobacterium cookii]|uniref:Oxidoreductase n=1 Tax=Mycobacterium cookii TaxID=1775 RepID=A0A7I7KTK8_9MYCO|nr:FAD-dependent oxidoreductase [Mycobacterium cookii]MCV7331244.1 FAD-dependent oxidoreductase [Mycobacterium cookii]BBX44798.1 oxidoreductase [Mycobacterium cookii]
MVSDDADVLVIGAGLAGLRCAGVLAAAGREVRVLELGDDVGGRVRTDAIDGFLCDRGFQVLNSAYPELRRAVDIPALGLKPFGAGVAVRRERSAAIWAHPLREPLRVPAMLIGGGIRPTDVLALSRWGIAALRPGRLTSPERPDTTLAAALDRARVRGEVRRVVDRFLAGVLLEDTGSTSNAFSLLLARMFLRGVPALPAEGMQALPRQLAAPLDDRIALNYPVTRIERSADGWDVWGSDGVTHAPNVVVAAGPVDAATLTGSAQPATHGVVTDWWASDDIPTTPPMLWVDGRADPAGPVLNTAVISKAAPSYAPPGRHLIAASALLDSSGAAPPEAVTRQHAGAIMGIDSRNWKPLIRNVIPHALPAQPPPLRARRPVRLGDGLWWCGDHRDTASIQGALVSGRRTAEQILAT